MNINAAAATRDWRGILQWEGRMEELVASSQSDDFCSVILSAFSDAHQMGWQATGSKDHARSSVGLEERQIPLLGKLQRFRDQGETMCGLAMTLNLLDRKSEAAAWFQRARDVGAAHGFFSLESTACTGLARAAMEEGHHEDSVALLRNALVAAELNELDDPTYELSVLQRLVAELLLTDSIEEVEPLVLRYREAAKAEREREGFSLRELDSIDCSARLHEVLYVCIPRWEPLRTASSLLAGRPSRICRMHMHFLNLALYAGTWEASRGREGGARYARPDARERGKLAERCRSVCRHAGGREQAPHHSRCGGWGGGAHQGGGSPSGHTACALALRVRSVRWSSSLHQ